MPVNAQPEVTIRKATPKDAAVCGAISWRAFSTLNAEHNFPCDFPNEEVAIGVTTVLFGHPGFYCVVAESGGRVIGSNCLDERSVIAGVGPVSVDPDIQNRGAGRKLMRAVMDRAKGRGAPGVRLVQAAFHNRSMALYTRLGFDIREPLACLQGRPAQRRVSGCVVRPATSADLEACDALSLKVHGFDRAQELLDGIEQKSAVVVERDGRITGYSSSLAFFGHSTAETNLDLQALIASADSFGGPGILLPSRNSTLLRWCLCNGLQIVQPMTLMSFGLYNEPNGAWLASVSF
ncbi:MAG TPA: GNAT family N-acetyltransferase [Acidobacteriaceae bacterium]|jgi:predicted N-acetyltransferase YhbS|nr:GNAT family N-acetyltransferase [Acidobacteriaceae bacterium]